METKYKTDATERKAPDISASVHLDATTEVYVFDSHASDGAWLGFKGHGYPSVSVWMPRDKLAEVSDVITAYLEGAS